MFQYQSKCLIIHIPALISPSKMHPINRNLFIRHFTELLKTLCVQSKKSQKRPFILRTHHYETLMPAQARFGCKYPSLLAKLPMIA